MNRNEAQAILNRVREGRGHQTPVADITAALHVTGDLRVDEAVRGAGLDTPLSRAGQTVRSHAGETVVVEDLRGFRAYSWARRFGRSQEANE